MKLKMTMLALMSLFLLSSAALAADANGTWTGKMCCGEAGSYPVTLILKVNGDKVTGTLAQGKAAPDVAQGKEGGQKFENGVLKGDEVSFSFSYPREGETFTVNYTAKIEGNEVTLTEQREGRKGKHGTLTRQ